MPRTVEIRVLALHIRCNACHATARIVPDCDVYARWAAGHMLPEILQAEMLVDGEYMRRPVKPG